MESKETRITRQGVGHRLPDKSLLLSAETSRAARSARWLQGIARALMLSQDEIDGLPTRAADSILPALVTYSTYIPSDGALEAMLSANVLEHVSDQTLRRGIAAWSRQMRIPEGQRDLLQEGRR